LIFAAIPALADTVVYGDVALSGGFQAGHFDDVYDLTAGAITISFTYDGNGLVDDFGGDAHAWAELGVRSVGYSDFNPKSNGDPAQKKVDLIAGQHTDVGDVIVWHDDVNLYVRYVITDPEVWCITETHLQVATDPDEIPQKNGNPIPGKFDFKDEHNCVEEFLYEIPLTWDVETPLYIAAHSVVKELSCYQDAVLYGT